MGNPSDRLWREDKAEIERLRAQNAEMVTLLTDIAANSATTDDLDRRTLALLADLQKGPRT